MRILYTLFTFLIIIPLGLISKLLYLIHNFINNNLILYKGYVENKIVRKWEVTVNMESKNGAWDYYYKLVDDSPTDGVKLLYFQGINDKPLYEIKVPEEDFQDLIDLMITLNKKTIAE